MKKLSILLIGLLLVTGFAFAQEVTATGEASLTFGVDLDGTPSTGFKNAASSTISLEWLSGSESSGEMGWITLSDWEISFANDDEVTVAAPTVSAGFMVDPVTVTIYSAPTFEAGNAASFVWQDDDEADDEAEVALSANNVTDPEDAYSTEGTWYLHDLVEGDADDIPDNAVLIDSSAGVWELYFVPDTIPGNDETPGFQGLTIAFDLDVATLSVLAASDGTWVENDDNAYAIGAELSATVDPLTLTGGVYAGPTDALDLGFTVGADVAVDPLTVGVGFDGFLAEGEAMDYDVAVDLGVALAGVSLTSNTYLWSTGGADLDLDQQVVLDATGVVEGLGFTETFQMIDVLAGFADGGTLAWYSLTEASYTVDGIKPYATFGIDEATVIDVTAGIEASGFVENTVFTLEYAVEDVGEDSLGAITFDATIKY